MRLLDVDQTAVDLRSNPPQQTIASLLQIKHSRDRSFFEHE
jgi:hypothetical protein